VHQPHKSRAVSSVTLSLKVDSPFTIRIKNTFLEVSSEIAAEETDDMFLLSRVARQCHVFSCPLDILMQDTGDETLDVQQLIQIKNTFLELSCDTVVDDFDDMFLLSRIAQKRHVLSCPLDRSMQDTGDEVTGVSLADTWRFADELEHLAASHGGQCSREANDTMVAPPSSTRGAYMINNFEGGQGNLMPVTHTQSVPQHRIQNDNEMTSRHSGAHERNRGRRGSKLWCHLYLDEKMLLEGFDLVPMIIGKGGMNLRNIFKKTGVKIRVRGRGMVVATMRGILVKKQMHISLLLSQQSMEKRNCLSRPSEMSWK